MGLKLNEKAPETVRDSVFLLVSRMTNEPLEKIVSERKRIEKRLEAEMKELLSKMKPEEVFHVFRIVAG